MHHEFLGHVSRKIVACRLYVQVNGTIAGCSFLPREMRLSANGISAQERVPGSPLRSTLPSEPNDRKLLYSFAYLRRSNRPMVATQHNRPHKQGTDTTPAALAAPGDSTNGVVILDALLTFATAEFATGKIVVGGTGTANYNPLPVPILSS